MTPTKLSDSDKREIIRLYRQSDENTITLAQRYGVSSSTVRRFLQSALSETEYESLVQQKQKRLPDRTIISPETEATDAAGDSPSSPSVSSSPLPAPAGRSSVTNLRPAIRRPLVPGSEVSPIEVGGTLELDLDVFENAAPHRVDRVGGENLKAMLPPEGLLASEDFSAFDDEDDEDDEDDADLEEFEGEDGEDEDSVFEGSLLGVRSSGESGPGANGVIQVLPLSQASLPKICYLVVDRAAELITRPLKAFGELGQIPAIETRQRTLPVFDNHRVARRFSTRNQRVFKIPDGKLLRKAAPYLQAKGITRLLIDGQVYSL